MQTMYCPYWILKLKFYQTPSSIRLCLQDWNPMPMTALCLFAGPLQPGIWSS